MKEFVFLSVQDVRAIHEIQVERFGGAVGLRDIGLLDSAVAQPKATFEGRYVHPGVFEMAAAYLFHIVSNHPFVDGNKRTGLATALVFLDLNGHRITSGTDKLYELTMEVACSEKTKAEIANTLRSLAIG